MATFYDERGALWHTEPLRRLNVFAKDTRMRWPLSRDGQTRLHLPSPRLLGCVRAYVVRDTTGLTTMAPSSNHYPANPYVSLIWLLHGQSMLVAPAERAGDLSATTLMGPQRRPWCTHNPGPVRSFGIVFNAESLHRLTGLNVAQLVDQALPAAHCFNATWLAWCQDVREAPNDAARIQRVETFLLAQLQKHGHSSPWAASARSMARRLREWMGMTVRDAAVLSRLERTLLLARQQHALPPKAWADVAADGGYSDQAHLCRQTRRATGLSPGQLAEHTHTDDAFWFYRLWRGTQTAPTRNEETGR